MATDRFEKQGNNVRLFLTHLARPAAILMLGVGLGLGVIVMLPLGVSLSSGNAQILAVVITAIVSIGGAVLLWHMQDAHKETKISEAIAMYWLPLFVFLQVAECDIARDLAKENTPADILSVRFARMSSRLVELDKKMTSFSQALQFLPAEKVLAFIQLEQHIQTLLLKQTLLAGRVRDNTLPTAAKPLLQKDFESVITQMAAIRELLEILAPKFDDKAKRFPSIKRDV